MNKLNQVLIIGICAIGCNGNEVNQNDKNFEKPVSMYVSSAEKEIYSQAQTYFQALPPLIGKNKNAIKEAKEILGKTLYLDVRLSRDGNISCNTCHKLDSYGVDNLSTSPGDKGINGNRNSPTTYNAALHTSQFWDGRAKDVEEQSGMPILNPIEMNIPDEAFLIDRLKNINEYKTLFSAAFPDYKEAISYDNLKTAIGAFERTLITPSRFDDFLNGDRMALSNEEKAGLKEFIDVGCVTCHSGQVLGGNMLQKFGVYGDYWEETGSKNIDEGKFEFSGVETDKYMFKVPSLRNIHETDPYLHDGSISDLKQVIRIMGKLQLNKELTEEQVERINTFLKSLTGDIPFEVTS